MKYLLPLLLLAGCSGAPRPERVVIQKQVVEVQKPCPVTAPDRPAPVGALPADARDAVLTLAAKLLEWSGAGGYGDRADAAIGICTKALP